jgi:hypothetical protein
MLVAGHLNDLNRVLSSLDDRIEPSAADRLIFFHPDSSAPPSYPDERRGFPVLPATGVFAKELDTPYVLRRSVGASVGQVETTGLLLASCDREAEPRTQCVPRQSLGTRKTVDCTWGLNNYLAFKSILRRPAA